MHLQDNKTRRLAFDALFLTSAMLLSYIEALIPLTPAIPGMKLGLANIAVTLAVFLYTYRDGFSVMLVRVVLCNILFGSVTSFFFALGGGILSCLSASVLKRFYGEKITLYGISVACAAMHNVGQTIAACIIFTSFAPFAMLWWLLLLSLPLGFITGFITQILFDRISKRI